MDPRLVLLAHAVCINAVRFGIAIQAVSARFAVNFQNFASVLENVYARILRIFGVYQIFQTAPLANPPDGVEIFQPVIDLADMALIEFGTAVKPRQYETLVEREIGDQFGFSRYGRRFR